MRCPGHSPSCPHPACVPEPGPSPYQERPWLADVEQLGQLEIWEAAKVSRCPAFGSCQPRALRPRLSRGGRDRARRWSGVSASRARIAHLATGEIRCLALQLVHLGERVELLRLVKRGALNRRSASWPSFLARAAPRWILRSDWPVLSAASAVKLSPNSSPFWRRVAFARPVAPGRGPALAAGQGKAARKNPTRRCPTDAPGSGSPLDRFGQRVDRGGSALARAKRLTVYAVFRACTPPPLPGSRSRPRQKRPAQSCCSGRAITIAGWSDTGTGKAGSRKPGIDSTQAPGRRCRGGLPLHKGVPAYHRASASLRRR